MTVSGSTAIVVSPHLDDAVFSCPGWIREYAKDGGLPVILTLFSHATPRCAAEVRQLYEQRQREDDHAARLLGAKSRLAGFVDAPMRRRAYQTFSGVVCQPVEGEADLVVDVRTYLKRVLETVKPRHVLAPLGVGQHIDHRITQHAMTELGLSYPHIQITYYEDRPYAFVDEAVRLRLAQLGRRAWTTDFESISPAQRSERFFSSFIGAPYARQHLRASDKAPVVAHMLLAFVQALQEPSKRADAVVESWPEEQVPDWLPALDAYTSQIRGFLGSPLYHQWAALEYARRLGYNGCYIERYWRL